MIIYVKLGKYLSVKGQVEAWGQIDNDHFPWTFITSSGIWGNMEWLTPSTSHKVDRPTEGT